FSLSNAPATTSTFTLSLHDALPILLGPFDYKRQNRTNNLWFAEGVTDYYAQITTYRTGLYDVNWLLGQLTGQIRQLQASRTRLLDRKSTRLNSSHQIISYAVFCLKK